MRSIHALLVGIDRYAGGVPELAGCVNDIRAVEELLPAIVADGVRARPPLVLLDEQATRDAVVAGFREHLTAAGPDDVALFWYTGHGAQQATAAGARRRRAGRARRDPGLPRLPRRRHLGPGRQGAGRAGRRGPRARAHVLVVLDCCHSGSGVRATDQGGTTVRRAPVDRRRPAGRQLPGPACTGTGGRAGWDLGRPGPPTCCSRPAGRTRPPRRPQSTAGGGGPSRPPCRPPWRTPAGRRSYADLVAWTGARIATSVRAQDPQLECTDPADARRGLPGRRRGRRPARPTGCCTGAATGSSTPVPCTASRHPAAPRPCCSASGRRPRPRSPGRPRPLCRRASSR